jgi:hypothetical protein
VIGAFTISVLSARSRRSRRRLSSGRMTSHVAEEQAGNNFANWRCSNVATFDSRH